MTVFTTLVGLGFVGLAIFAFIAVVTGIVSAATNNYQGTSQTSVILGQIFGGALGTALASYLAYRWFVIPVTPFTLTIGGRKWY